MLKVYIKSLILKINQLKIYVNKNNKAQIKN